MASSAGSAREMTPLELMRHRNGLMHSAESIRNGREFETRPTDVFIVTYPKYARDATFRATRGADDSEPSSPRARVLASRFDPLTRARRSPRSSGAARRG